MVGVVRLVAVAFLALEAGVTTASDSNTVDQAEFSKLVARMTALEEGMTALEEEVATLKSERQQLRQQAHASGAETFTGRRRLAVDDIDSYAGIQIAKEKGRLSFGTGDTGDSHILRTGPAQLMVLADNTTFAGDVCMYTQEGTTYCLGDHVECSSVDVTGADDYAVGLVYTGPDNVHNGQFVSSSSVHCAYGYTANPRATWECTELGGTASPLDQICVPATCSTVNITGHITSFSGGAHDDAEVTTGDVVDGVTDCADGHYENTEATWICPKEGGIAVPSDSLCLCDSSETYCDPLSNVVESGVYTITGLGSEPFDAYIDVDDDGVQWLMQMAIYHDNYDSRKCSIDMEMPLDPADSYASTALVDYMPEAGADDIASVRFYCDTDQHSRVIHYTTDNSYQRAVAVSGDLDSNSPSYWSSGYTLLDDHSANLPEATGSTCCRHATFSDDSIGWADAFFMYLSSTYHYAACGLQDRWECDDFPGDDRAETNHRIYVSFSDPDSINAVFQY